MASIGDVRPYIGPREDVCPYYRSKDLQYSHIFRLEETFNNSSSKYVGDSFGDAHYVNPYDSRKCSSACACREIHSRPRGVFSFVIRKTPSTMMIDINSVRLWILLGCYSCHGSQSFNGFTLLEHREDLAAQLSDYKRSASQYRDLISELDLLVNGVLSDYEVFQSYDYEDLYQKRLINEEIRGAFQDLRFERDLDALENAFSSDDGSGQRHDEPQHRSFDEEPGTLYDIPRVDDSEERYLLNNRFRACESVKFRTCLPEATPLMQAIAYGSYDDAEKLLNAGADPDEMAAGGTAIGTAALLRSEDSIRLLLMHGADPQLASVALQSEESWDFFQVCPLKKLQLSYQEALLKRHKEALDFLQLIVVRFSKDARKCFLRQLRREFFQQHKKAARQLESHPLEQSKEGPCYGIQKQAGHAWSTGIQAMRNLNRGISPSGIGETLMLLLVASSMAVVMDKSYDLISERQFNLDLPRWQMIFKDGLSQNHFRNAVLDIWNVDIKDHTLIGSYVDHPGIGSPYFSPDVDGLTELRDTTLRFIVRAGTFFALTLNASQGLISSQHAWRQTIQPERLDHGHHGTPNTNADLDRDESTRGEPRIHKPPDIDSPSLSLAMLLMAGAIFGIILAFLLAISLIWSRSRPIASTRSTPRHYKNLDPVWQSAVKHMSTVMEAKFSDPQILEEVESITRRVEEQIRLGKFTTLSSLNQVVPESPSLAQEIRVFCTQWQSTYTMECNNHLLRLYMGDQQFVSIVPHRIFPRTIASALVESPVSSERRTSFELSQGPSSRRRGDDDNLDNPVCPFEVVLPTLVQNEICQEMDLDSSPTASNSVLVTPDTAQVTSSLSLGDGRSSEKRCLICHKTFSSVGNFNRHMKKHSGEPNVFCKHGCGYHDDRKDNVRKHEEKEGCRKRQRQRPKNRSIAGAAMSHRMSDM